MEISPRWFVEDGLGVREARTEQRWIEIFSYKDGLADATSNSGAKVDTLELSKF